MKRMLASCLALLLALSSFGCGGQASTDKNVEWGRADAKEIDVNSKVAGRVVELLVKEGDEVKEGQVIARIDKRDLEAQKAQYEANIEAIRLLQTLDAEQRQATAEEQEVLSRYVGWGGIPQAFDEKNADWAKEYAELKSLLPATS